MITACYHGRRADDGKREIIVHYPERGFRGPLRHVVRHSPAGMDWGYRGAGPADLARSLLIHALGTDARCRQCKGTRRVVWTGDGPRPFHPDRAAFYAPHAVARCPSCDDGYRPLPYQDFKDEYVAGWSDCWRVGQVEILGFVWSCEYDPRTAR